MIQQQPWLGVQDMPKISNEKVVSDKGSSVALKIFGEIDVKNSGPTPAVKVADVG